MAVAKQGAHRPRRWGKDWQGLLAHTRQQLKDWGYADQVALDRFEVRDRWLAKLPHEYSYDQNDAWYGMHIYLFNNVMNALEYHFRDGARGTVLWNMQHASLDMAREVARDRLLRGSGGQAKAAQVFRDYVTRTGDKVNVAAEVRSLQHQVAAAKREAKKLATGKAS